MNVLPLSLRSAATGNSGTQTVDPSTKPYAKNVNVFLNVTASNVPTTLDVKVQWSFDGAVWADATPADSFTQVGAVATSQQIKQVTIKAPFWRVAWAIAGTSYTFSVDANLGS